MVAVAVVATELTVIVPGPLSSTRNVVPDGLANCRPVAPSAVLSCVATEAMPPEKSMPTTVSLGSVVAAFDSGSTLGSSTRTMLTVCWTFDESV